MLIGWIVFFRHLVLIYYWVNVVYYWVALSPYHLSYQVEVHAAHTYEKYLETHDDEKIEQI